MKKLLPSLFVVFFCLIPNLTFGSGKCIVGDCVNGEGTMTYPDGSKYKGEWKNGSFNGQGTFTLTDEWQYEGEWKDGERHGTGTMIYPGGKYVGEFKEGERHGKGIEKHIYGREMESFWLPDNYAGKEKPEELKEK